MTRALAALALACAGCAAVSGGGRPESARTTTAAGDRAFTEHISLEAAPTTLRWHAPTVLRDGSAAHDRQDQIVLRLRSQWPAYYPGVWLVPGDWTALVAWCRPDTDAVLRGVLPGAACSLAVAPGQHVVVARNAAGPSGWSNVVVTQ